MTTNLGAAAYRCDICGCQYTSQKEAFFCEQRGVGLPRFVAGDVIQLLASEVSALHLSSPDVLIDQREFNAQAVLSHSFAFASRGVRYHVRAQGGRKLVVEAVAVTVDASDFIYCPDWPTFFRQADTGRSHDMEGLDALRQTLNQKLGLGL